MDEEEQNKMENMVEIDILRTYTTRLCTSMGSEIFGVAKTMTVS